MKPICMDGSRDFRRAIHYQAERQAQLLRTIDLRAARAQHNLINVNVFCDADFALVREYMAERYPDLLYVARKVPAA